jgi:hypothetical protein
MANVNQPFGLSPVGTIGAHDWNGQTHLYWIPSTDTTAYAVGDPVGSIHNSDAAGIPGVAIGAAGAPLRGVITAIRPNPANLDSASTIPATKAQDYYVYVADDPNTIFEIQEGAGTALTAADVNLNANVTIAEPSLAWQLSQTVIAVASANTTSTLNLRLLWLAQKVGNAYGNYAVWQCIINSHELRAGATATP